MNIINKFTADYYGKFQHKYFADEKLADGFIEHHKKNFQKYFCLKESGFKGKKILETGCGSGKHAVVLALMGADVTAVDLSKDNLKIAGRFRKIYRLKNIKLAQHDLMRPFKEQGQFDLISVHNWVHHTKNPSIVIKNLVSILKPNGIIYLSAYRARSFRFFTTYIARQVLKRDYIGLMQDLVKYHFPLGFKEFNNPKDVFLENIFDDYFVPYVMPIDYDILSKDLKNLGCIPVMPLPPIPSIYGLDNIDLRMGFKKKRDVDYKGKLLFTRAVDEFNGKLPSIVAQSIKLSKETIKYISKLNNPRITCDFCLGLYRIRARTCYEDMETKHAALQKYLYMVLSKSLKPISYIYDAQRLYKK